MRLTPKFIGNEPDNNHCLQASILTVTNALDIPLTLSEADRLTGYDPALYTWVIQGAALLSQKLKGVRLQTVFDYHKFVKDGESYLIGQWGAEKLEAQKKKSSEGFAKERKAAADFLVNGTIELVKFEPTNFVNELKGHLIIAIVNAPTLYGQPGYSFHFVVIYGSSNGGNWYFLHDPGLPHKPAQRVEAKSFWASFGEEFILVPHSSIPFGATFNANDPCYCGSGKAFKDCHRNNW